MVTGLTAILLTASAFAAEAGQAGAQDPTYNSMYMYKTTNPHTVQPNATQEKALDDKVADKERKEVKDWNGVMGRSDRPAEYLGKDHK
jgi:hypothetical protein